MIRWFARNDIAANFLLIGILCAGIYVALNKVPLQVEPTWEFDSIYISMDYRGGNAADVQRYIVIPIEEAIRDLTSIKSIRSTSSRGKATIWVSVDDVSQMRDVLDEVQARIDQITTFPGETERPDVRLPDSDSWREVITLAVVGDLEEDEMQRVAERVRDDLIDLPHISQAQIKGERPYEIAVEVSQEKLRSFGISFQDLSDAIRSSSVDLPAGSIQSPSGNLTIRTKGQAYTRADFEKIPVRASNGAEVLLSEVATVKDGFDEERQIVRFNGRPAVMVEAMRHDDESAIKISEQVQLYVDSVRSRFPEGIDLYAWDDESIAIRGRLSTLGWSLVQGSVLVFLLLGLFLRPALAFWVVIGIPVSFAGGLLFMPLFGVTANLMSVFGFIIVLGLVVDDAIVTGENIFSKLRSGMDPLEASVKGAEEVAVPVTFGVITTVVAFLPLLYWGGHWSTYAKQIPPIVAPVLLFSLIESKLILPSHLKHLRVGRKRLGTFARFQKRVADSLEWFVDHVYTPTLCFAVRHRYGVVAVFFAMAMLMAGYWQSGRLGFVSIPSVDNTRITASIDFPNDTPLETTDRYVKRIAAAVDQLKTEFTDGDTGRSLIINTYMETGDGGWRSSTIDTTEGDVSIEIMPPSQRSEPGPRNSDISKRWREIVGEIPEAVRFRMRDQQGGYSMRREQEGIELELRGKGSELKNDIANRIEALFEEYDEIADAYAQVNSGSDELEIKLKPRAVELQLTQQLLATQVRQALFGQEAQRVLRGRDDIRVMVRLTQEERRSLHTLDTLKIRTPSGSEVSLASVASVKFVKAPGRLERVDGAEVIDIGAIPKDEDVDIMRIAREVAPGIQALVNEGEDLSFRYTGYIAENEESKRRTWIMFAALLATLYALLAIPFKSLVQPIFVLLAVPFGIIGALLGHIIMDITPSYLSIFGLLALSGVVVNDSLVMVDFINKRRAEGMCLRKAILTAGGARFRPIMLTSATTFAGLMPLMFDRSIQAQFLIPMAVSLGFGILFATVITLYLIPAAYQISADIGKVFGRAWGWWRKPFRDEIIEQPSESDIGES
ncbi:MAG: multidrug efflux pump subunit AcrB [Verrucomicrobiales bacterium]|jgi:multidrug efflux pump subunit AcrB